MEKAKHPVLAVEAKQPVLTENTEYTENIDNFRAFDPIKDLPESFYINIVASRRSGKGVMT